MHLQSTPRRACFLERESNYQSAVPAIASQDRALREEIARRGDVVTRVVVAAGYSGSLPPTERPDFEEILEAAERNEFDYVLGTEIARCNRGEEYSYYYLKHELQRLGVGLEFLDQQFSDDGESEIGALTEGLAVLLPSIEKRTIIRRFKRGRDRVRAEGYGWTGVSPFGYEYVKGGQHGHTWRKQADEVPWVEQIFKWAEGGASRAAIARRLAAAGVPTRNGGKWWASTISGILANPRYKGEWPDVRWTLERAKSPFKPRPTAAGTKTLHKKRRRVRTSHKLRPQGEWGTVRLRPDLAIISPELWQRANDMAARNAAASPRRSKAPSLLKGLIWCEHEHEGQGPRAMTYHGDKDRQARYRCRYRGGPSGPRCYGAVTASDVEGRIWNYVCELALEPKPLLDRVIAGEEQTMALLRRLRAALEAADREVKKWQGALDRLDLARYTGEMDEVRHARLSTMARESLDAAEAVRKRVHAEIEPLKHSTVGALADALLERYGPAALADDGMEALCAAVREVLGAPTRAELEALDLEGRRARVRQVIERVVVGPEGIFAVLVLGAGKVHIADRTSSASAASHRCTASPRTPCAWSKRRSQ